MGQNQNPSQNRSQSNLPNQPRLQSNLPNQPRLQSNQPSLPLTQPLALHQDPHPPGSQLENPPGTQLENPLAIPQLLLRSVWNLPQFHPVLTTSTLRRMPLVRKTWKTLLLKMNLLPDAWLLLERSSRCSSCSCPSFNF